MLSGMPEVHNRLSALVALFHHHRLPRSIQITSSAHIALAASVNRQQSGISAFAKRNQDFPKTKQVLVHPQNRFHVQIISPQSPKPNRHQCLQLLMLLRLVEEVLVQPLQLQEKPP